AEPGAGAEAVGISGGAAASAGFGGDVAGADVAAGLPPVGGLGAGRRHREAYGQNGASVHVDLHAGWAPGWHMKQASGATTRLCARARTGILIRIKQTRDLAATRSLRLGPDRTNALFRLGDVDEGHFLGQVAGVAGRSQALERLPE